MPQKAATYSPLYEKAAQDHIRYLELQVTHLAESPYERTYFQQALDREKMLYLNSFGHEPPTDL